MGKMQLYFIHNSAHTEREPLMKETTDVFRALFPHIKVHHIWEKSGRELEVPQVQKFLLKGNSETHFVNACSLVLHHMRCLTHFIESGDDFAVVLEDDAYVNSAEELKATFARTKGMMFDSVYLGDGCQPDIYDGRAAEIIKTPWSRCTEAMLYSKEGAMKVLQYFHIKQAIKQTEPQLDFFFNKAYREMEATYDNFHAHPAPMSQATAKNKLQSRILYNHV